MALIRSAPAVRTALLLYVVQIIPSAVLILTTAQGSLFRFLWIPVLGYTGYRFFRVSKSLTTSSAYNATLVGLDLVFALQCMNLLVFGAWDKQHLLHERYIAKSDDFLSMLMATLGLVHNPRGLNTSRPAKGTPPLPEYITQYGEEASPSRYLLRQTSVWIWQWLLLDALFALDRMEPEDVFNRLYGKGAEFRYISATGEEWFAKFFGPILNLFVVARLSVDLMFRLISIAAVGFGLSAPADWPPSFGSMWDAYTLRNFWGSFMPQYLRWPLTAASRFVTLNILHLPKPSLLERYTHTLIVFTISGLWFTIIDSVMGVPLAKSGAAIFLASFAGGILLEDSFQAMWGQGSISNSTTVWWAKALGGAWVLFFLALVTPWILYPGKRVPMVDRWLLPGSVTNRVGMPAIWTVIVGGGTVLKYIFDAGL